MLTTLVLSAILLVLIVLLYLLSRKSKVLKLFCTPLAVCITAGLMLITCLILGLISQNPESQDFLSRIGLRSFKDSPWFISSTMLFLLVLGMFIIEQYRLHPKNTSPHLFTGIWVVVFGILMSNLSIQRYLWIGWKDVPKWEATLQSPDPQSKKLPFAIEVSQYRTDYYPPVIYIVDSKTGRVLPLEKPTSMPIDIEQYKEYAAGKGSAQQKQIQEWDIKLVEYLPHAWVHFTDGQYSAESTQDEGNAPAAKVEMKSNLTGETKTTWLSCGSALQLPSFLRLDSSRLIGMEDPVPSHFIAHLNLYEIQGDTGIIRLDSVWPNHPIGIDGYDIYLKSVKTEAGLWNPDVQLELVKDPWKPVVYGGLGLILLSLLEMLIKGLFCKKKQSND